MGKRRVALLGGGNLTRELVRYAEANDIEYVSYGNVPDFPTHQISVRQRYVDCTDATVMLPLLEEDGIDGILCCSSEGIIRKSVEWLSKVGKGFYCTPEQWQNLMNKNSLQSLWSKYGMPVIPVYQEDSIPDSAFPVIVKPVDNGGSYGITICSNRNSVRSAVKCAEENSQCKTVIIEKFLHGDFFQFDFWIQNGLVYVPYTKSRFFYPSVDNRPEQPFLDIYPSRQSDKFSTLYEPLARIMHDLNIKDGTCFFQGIIEDGVPYLIDVALRLGGGMDFRVVERQFGIDLIGSYLDYALGKGFGTKSFESLCRPYDRRYCTLSVGVRNGIVSRLEGIKEIDSLPGVFSTYQYYQVGDEVVSYGMYLQTILRVYIEETDGVSIPETIERVRCLLHVYDQNGVDMLIEFPDYHGAF